MKRWLILLALLAASGAALFYSQRQKGETHVGPEGMLNALADTEREWSRIPASLTRLSDQQEIRVGDAMAENYLARRPVLSGDDLELEKYVSSVGQSVSAHARRKLDYRFHYLPDAGLVNAFALPGGHVFIGKGLVQMMTSEDELASVLGHETEHVDHYHCNDRVALQSRLRHMPLAQLVMLPVELFQAGYSKEQEMEADGDGTALAVAAGYSPQGALDLFQTFARLRQRRETKPGSPGEELSQVAIGSLAGYFRSHPFPEEREAQVRRLIAANKWPQPAERPLRVRPEAAKSAHAGR
ncbi:MAG TPA: M48 family metalloprotease [Candidatus Angelobacter sp.]|nr:M48 family metalloprotease [Candidatus Angelobacter sp.]